MEFVTVKKAEGIAILTLSRGKVNAIEESAIAELSESFAALAADPDIKGVILTGQGKFFSFGFDVPVLYERSPEDMTSFVQNFCHLYRDIFLFPKPVVAAINGHAMAGGCILALACDYRIVVDASVKIALNEVTFGAMLFAGVIELVRFAAGNRAAEEMLLTGRPYSPLEAKDAGLVDLVVDPDELMTASEQKARTLAHHVGPAYAALKRLHKQPVVDAWRQREEHSIREWIDLWYSPATRAKTKGIVIR